MLGSATNSMSPAERELMSQILVLRPAHYGRVCGMYALTLPHRLFSYCHFST